MILTATMLWSFENIIAKKVLKNISSEIVGLFRMGIGGSLLIFTTLLTNKIGFISTIQQFSNLAIIFIGGTILFFYVYTWYKALKYAPASLVTLILTFSIVVGNILHGVFAGIKFLPNDLNTAILISIAMLIIFIFTFIKKLSFLDTK